MTTKLAPKHLSFIERFANVQRFIDKEVFSLSLSFIGFFLD